MQEEEIDEAMDVDEGCDVRARQAVCPSRSRPGRVWSRRVTPAVVFAPHPQAEFKLRNLNLTRFTLKKGRR